MNGAHKCLRIVFLFTKEHRKTYAEDFLPKKNFSGFQMKASSFDFNKNFLKTFDALFLRSSPASTLVRKKTVCWSPRYMLAARAPMTLFRLEESSSKVCLTIIVSRTGPTISIKNICLLFSSLYKPEYVIAPCNRRMTRSRLLELF